MSTSTTATLGGQVVEIDHGPAAVSSGYPESGLLGLDVETTYMDDRGQFSPDFRVRTVQLATERVARVFDLTDPAQRERAVELLSDPAYTFVSHTPMDVLSVWVGLGIDITDRNVDTRMLASQADTRKEADRDLKALASHYGMPELAEADRELYAWMQEVWPGRRNAKRSDIEAHGWNLLAGMPAEEWPEVFTRYAGLDALAARRLAPLLIPATGNPATVIETDHWLQVRANRRQLAGMRVDPDRLAHQLREARSLTGRAKETAEELTGGININGPKIVDWLGEHGVRWDEWTGDRSEKTGSPSLAKENLAVLQEMDMDETARDVVGQMVVFRRHQDMLRKCEAVDTRVVVEANGIARIHPQLNPLGATTTARMSSTGPNIQNFSKKDPRARGMFLPEPGYVLATIDFAQIELRVVAALAREESMIETILAGEDLHQLTVDLLASQGVEITRDTAKMANFLIVYGGGPRALASQARIPLDVSSSVVYGMREAYPGITALSKWLGYERNAIRTVANRRLPVTRTRDGDVRAYANINYAVQSAARELLVYAWRRLEIDHGRAGIVWFPIHDELVLHIPENEVAEVLADAEESMRFDFRGVPITADAVVLRDEQGVSRWMTSKLAEKIAKEVS